VLRKLYGTVLGLVLTLTLAACGSNSQPSPVKNQVEETSFKGQFLEKECQVNLFFENLASSKEDKAYDYQALLSSTEVSMQGDEYVEVTRYYLSSAEEVCQVEVARLVTEGTFELIGAVDVTGAQNIHIELFAAHLEVLTEAGAHALNALAFCGRVTHQADEIYVLQGTERDCPVAGTFPKTFTGSYYVEGDRIFFSDSYQTQLPTDETTQLPTDETTQLPTDDEGGDTDEEADDTDEEDAATGDLSPVEIVEGI
jgi:hypothetical protein